MLHVEITHLNTITDAGMVINDDIKILFLFSVYGHGVMVTWQEKRTTNNGN